MIIRRSRIRNLDRYLGNLIPKTAIKFVVEVDQVPAADLVQSGFDGMTAGQTLLPAVVGKVTKRNAEGDYVVHKDRPKESRFVGRREWTRKEWAGRDQTREVTEAVDVERMCYPRTFVPPPGVELTVVEHDGRTYVTSPTTVWRDASNDDVLHLINLFLELFGEAEVRHENLDSFTPPHTQRVNWSMLPPGANTVTGVLAHVRSIIAARKPSLRGPIEERLTIMASKNPDEVVLGHGGYHAYVAYIFNKKGYAILESVLPDNATYVFDQNWQVVSGLTKTQVLDGNFHIDRIIHDGGWPVNLAKYV
jgi:hypothetical protein